MRRTVSLHPRLPFFATLAFTSVLFTSCALSNPLLGEWLVYRVQKPDGTVVDLPAERATRITYYRDSSVQYEQGSQPKTLSYSLHRDMTGRYIRVNWGGRWYGQRFSVLEEGNIRWDLFEPGTTRPAKMWMRRVAN